MFKDLGLIESRGTGIGKAKRSLLDNGSPELHFEEFPEDVDITSVSIPVNKEYLALEDELYIGDEKMNIGAENTNINVQINSIKGRIEALSATPRQKEALLKLVEPLFGKVFGRREVLMILGCAVATGTKYVAILESAGAIEPVQGLGKGKYRFAVKWLPTKPAVEDGAMKDLFAEIKPFQAKPEKTEQFETLVERMSADQAKWEGCVSIRYLKRSYTIDGIELGDPPREWSKVVKRVKHYSYCEFDSKENYGEAIKRFFECYAKDLWKPLITPLDINLGYALLRSLRPSLLRAKIPPISRHEPSFLLPHASNYGMRF